MSIDKFIHSLDIPAQAVLKVAHIEMVDNTEVMIEGMRRVLEYEDDRIKLDIGKKAVVFSGEGLCIRSYENGNATIDGTILRIEFESAE